MLNFNEVGTEVQKLKKYLDKKIINSYNFYLELDSDHIKYVLCGEPCENYMKISYNIFTNPDVYIDYINSFSDDEGYNKANWIPQGIDSEHIYNYENGDCKINEKSTL